MRELIPEDRKWGYPIRDIIEVICDQGSFLELRRNFGRSVVTGFFRLEGKPFGILANDCQQLGGAIDAMSAEKASEFLTLCDEHNIPIVSMVDTPGFMVGPESEEESAVTRMSKLFKTGAKLSVPLVAIYLRKAYGLGAMAMVGVVFMSQSTLLHGQQVSLVGWDWKAQFILVLKESLQQLRTQKNANSI